MASSDERYNQRLDDFEKELEHLVNRHSLENESATPDFIIARYLRQCLENFNEACRARKDWFSK